jgi:hypothetical protein
MGPPENPGRFNSHADDMASDPDLKDLHADPAFVAIVARARRNAGRQP